MLAATAALAGLVAAGGGAESISAEAEVVVAGRPQVVFDWRREACSPLEEPDLPARAIRDSSGRVQLLLSHYVSYRLTGPTLNRLRPRCRPVMTSVEDPDPRSFQDRRWVASPFTRDGRHVWALVHEEYQGNRHPGRCPERAYYPCWYNAITLARSSDGGRSYRQARPPRQLVAAPARRYRHGLGPTGVFAPSNVIERGGYFYALVRVREPAAPSGDCLLRSGDIGSPGSWRAWDGSSFDLTLADPYRAGTAGRRCRRIAPDQISEMTESLTFNTEIDRYLLVGVAGPVEKGPAAERGVYFSTSTDLVHWSPRQLVLRAPTLHSYRCGRPSPVAYPSVIDPASRGRSFETSGRHAYLYFTKFRYRNCQKTPDRDLMRVRLSISRRG
ncbi:MAG TPA: hypothetical protein VLC07_09725 [Solirubrobacterales bacterium]|nr:hypothetical protein [Solirubrobacterales bacterium]